MKYRGLWASVLLTLLPVSSTLAQGSASNQIELLYGDGYDGRHSGRMAVLTLKDARAWRAGDSFLFADFSDLGNYENHGSLYMEWGPRLSLGRTFGDTPLAFGPVRDVYLVGELNYVNNKVLANTTYLAGVSVDLAVPGFRFVKVSLMNRNDPSRRGHTQQMSVVWNYPFTIGGNAFTFEGFMDYLGGEAGARTSYHTQPQLIWHLRPRFDVGMEHQYWRNKNGRKGLSESVTQALVRWNF